MSLQALCLIKVLVIFTIFECCVCEKEESTMTAGEYIQHGLLKANDSSTVLGFLAKCMKFDSSHLVFHYKVLATDDIRSRLLEIHINVVQNLLTNDDITKFEIESRDVFNATKCAQMDDRFPHCTIKYDLCKKKFKTTDGGRGLYTRTSQCVRLLEKLGYNKTDYEELPLIKENKIMGVCPLTDMEIILLVPNMFYSQSEDRQLTTDQLKPVFEFLRDELHAQYNEYKFIEFIDGPHRITNGNKVLEYYVKLQDIAGNQTSWAVRRDLTASNTPLLNIRLL